MPEPFEIISEDNLALKGKLWKAEDSRGTIVLIHGFGEHIGRFNHVTRHFASQNLNVIAMDLRGHGHSEGKKGHTPGYNLLINDIGKLIAYANEKFTGLPLILYGHSMGANLATNYILKTKDYTFKALILTSPWFRLQFSPPAWQVTMGRLMRKIWPTFSQSNNLNPNDISSDTEVAKAYASDPLVNDQITTEMFFSIVEAGEWAMENAHEIDLPTLVIHGADDQITSSQASKQFAESCQADYKLWPNMRHETHNELGKEQVLGSISEWLIKNA